MSKWSKRSPEEKVRILAEQEALRNKNKPKMTAGFNLSNENQEAIIKNNEIPLVCTHHGYTAAERYEIVNENVIGSTIPMVCGICPICKQTARRALLLDETSMILMLIVKRLQDAGRLVDKR